MVVDAWLVRKSEAFSIFWIGQCQTIERMLRSTQKDKIGF